MRLAQKIELLRQQFRTAATGQANLEERRELIQAWWQLLNDDGVVPQQYGLDPDQVRELTTRLSTDPSPAAIDRTIEILDGLTSVWYADGSLQNSDPGRWESLGHILSHEVGARSILFTCATRRGNGRVFVRLSFPYADTLRLQLDAYAEPPEEAGGGFSAVDKDEAIFFSTTGVLVKVETPVWRMSVHSPSGEEICREVEGCNLGFCTSPTGSFMGVRESLSQTADEHFCGFGERFDSLDQKGKAFSIWVTDSYTQNYAHRDHTTYIPIPFFISSRGYGLFVNSYHRMFFDMGEAIPDRYTFVSADNKLDYYLIVAPGNPLQAIQRYTDIVGKPLLPPRWAFTPWMCRGSWKRDIDPTAGSRLIIETTRELKIPFGVAYPDAARFTKDDIDELHRQGIRVAQWAGPAVLPAETVLSDEEAWQLDYLHRLRMSWDEVKEFAVSEGEKPFTPNRNEFLDGKYYIDFTNPKACERFRERTTRPHFLALGYDSLMLDGGEALRESAVYFNGKTGREMHNAYLPSYHKAYADAFRAERGEDFLFFSRAGSVGSHLFAAQFSGDHDADLHSLGAIMRGGLNMGLCGFPYQLPAMLPGGVWGLKGEGVARDVYIRWIQFNTFWSLMLTYGMTPYEIELYGEDFVRIYRYYACLRMNLDPYIYHHAIVSHKTGVPIVRPLFVAFPEDKNSYAVEDQYLFGPSFLVAPVIREESERQVYLPAGEWVDFWDSAKRHIGPARFACSTPVDRIPVFIRAGSIIPLELNCELRLGEHSFSAKRFLVFDIYPTCVLTEFECFSAEEKMATAVSCRTEGQRIKVDLRDGSKDLILRIDTRRPRSCCVAGMRLNEFFALEEFVESASGFLYNHTCGKVFVKAGTEDAEISLE